MIERDALEPKALEAAERALSVSCHPEEGATFDLPAAIRAYLSALSTPPQAPGMVKPLGEREVVAIIEPEEGGEYTPEEQVNWLLSDLNKKALVRSWAVGADALSTLVSTPPVSAGELTNIEKHVAEQVAECAVDGIGMWRTCTGCHESEDGYDVGHYPFSKAFQCKLGGGCRECGGIGAVWDTIDYADMGRELSAVEPPVSGEVGGLVEPVFQAVVPYIGATTSWREIRAAIASALTAANADRDRLEALIAARDKQLTEEIALSSKYVGLHQAAEAERNRFARELEEAREAAIEECVAELGRQQTLYLPGGSRDVKGVLRDIAVPALRSLTPTGGEDNG